jgi:hypothetical protein
MEAPGKERLASLFMEKHETFEMALLDNKRRYPTSEFKAFAEAARRYLMQIKDDQFVRMDVARALHGLVENLRSERKRVPESVLWEAERLECLLFLGYDPHFEGDEPPGL